MKSVDRLLDNNERRIHQIPGKYKEYKQTKMQLNQLTTHLGMFTISACPIVKKQYLIILIPKNSLTENFICEFRR